MRIISFFYILILLCPKAISQNQLEIKGGQLSTDFYSPSQPFTTRILYYLQTLELQQSDDSTEITIYWGDGDSTNQNISNIGLDVGNDIQVILSMANHNFGNQNQYDTIYSKICCREGGIINIPNSDTVPVTFKKIVPGNFTAITYFPYNGIDMTYIESDTVFSLIHANTLNIIPIDSIKYTLVPSCQIGYEFPPNYKLTNQSVSDGVFSMPIPSVLGKYAITIRADEFSSGTMLASTFREVLIDIPLLLSSNSIESLTTKLKFFPNPASNSFSIQSSSKSAVLCDLYGHNLRFISLQKGKSDIDVSELTPGLYLLKTDKGEVGKVMVER